MRRKLIAAFSLTELLISLFLGALLSSIVLQQYCTLKSQFTFLTQALSQSMEENLSIDLLRETLHSVGFTPYGSIHNLQEIQSQVALSAALTSVDNGLVSYRMSADIAPLLNIYDTTIQIPDIPHVKVHSKIAVVNWCCYQIAVVKEVETVGQHLKLTLEHAISQKLQNNSFVGIWLEEHFIIQNKKQQTGLYYKHHHTEQLHHQWNTLNLKELSLSQGSASISYKNTFNKTHLITSRLENV